MQNKCLPFLDHLTEGWKTRFDKHGLIIQKIHVSVPSVTGIGKVDVKNKIEDIIHEYGEDLLCFRKIVKVGEVMERCQKNMVFWQKS